MDRNPFEMLVSDDKPREQQVEDIALQFYALAEKIENARVNEIDPKTFVAIMDANSYLWRFTSNLAKYNFWEDTGEETKSLIDRIADFMYRSGRSLSVDKNEELMAKMVAMNVNMCNHILEQQAVELGQTTKEESSASLAGLVAASKPIFT